MNILLEEETIEGDDLRNVLDGLDNEMPPAVKEPTPPPAPTDAAPEPEEKPAPKPNFGKPGLAWGSQSNITLDAHDEPEA